MLRLLYSLQTDHPLRQLQKGSFKVDFIFYSQNPQHFNDSFDGSDVTIMIGWYLFPIGNVL